MNMDRVIVVASLNGEKFVGSVAEGVNQEDVERTVLAGGPIELFDVRNYVAQMQPVPGPNGSVLGVKSFAAFLPVDVMTGPVKRMMIRASHYYWVKDDPTVVIKMKQLFRAAEESEIKMRAQESGITLP